jgi:hypothetical protein
MPGERRFHTALADQNGKEKSLLYKRLTLVIRRPPYASLTLRTERLSLEGCDTSKAIIPSRKRADGFFRGY